MSYGHNYGHSPNKKGLHKSCNPLILLARPAGFEPAACGFEVRRSIQLSYGRASGPGLNRCGGLG